jgi:hypothetical protein
LLGRTSASLALEADSEASTKANFGEAAVDADVGLRDTPATSIRVLVDGTPASMCRVSTPPQAEGASVAVPQIGILPSWLKPYTPLSTACLTVRMSSVLAMFAGTTMILSASRPSETHSCFT